MMNGRREVTTKRAPQAERLKGSTTYVDGLKMRTCAGATVLEDPADVAAADEQDDQAEDLNDHRRPRQRGVDVVRRGDRNCLTNGATAHVRPRGEACSW